MRFATTYRRAINKRIYLNRLGYTCGKIRKVRTRRGLRFGFECYR